LLQCGAAAPVQAERRILAAQIVPFYIGDDVTDRDAFRALHGKGISLLVSEEAQPTCADYRLSDPAEVGVFLDELSALLRERKE